MPQSRTACSRPPRPWPCRTSACCSTFRRRQGPPTLCPPGLRRSPRTSIALTAPVAVSRGRNSLQAMTNSGTRSILSWRQLAVTQSFIARLIDRTPATRNSRASAQSLPVSLTTARTSRRAASLTSADPLADRISNQLARIRESVIRDQPLPNQLSSANQQISGSAVDRSADQRFSVI